LDLAIKADVTPGAAAVGQSELSASERSYLGRLSSRTLVLERTAPEIEDRLQALNILAQRDGLLTLTRKGRTIVGRLGQPQ